MDDPRIEDADYHRYNGEYEQAIEIYDALLEADEANFLARHGRALCYCFVGEFDQSISELELVRNAQPQLVKARIDLFKTYLMLGMNDEAKSEMNGILEIEPDNEEVRKHRGYFE